MSGAMLVLIVTGILGVILGWLVPILFKSRRPYGVLGDILACAIPSMVLAYVEWEWVLPAIGLSEGWIALILAVGDPLGLGLLLLWVLRKIKS
jgi:hypothetical protein